MSEHRPNDPLVDDMYQQYLADPTSVAESWREFFSDYKSHGGRLAEPTQRPRATTTEVDVAPAAAPVDAPDGAEPLKGAQAAIVRNMEASLGVPTATSVRTVPARLLEENRKIINDYLSQGRGGKASFTHLIGWAIVQGLRAVPGMNASFHDVDGTPHVVRHKDVNLGLAVDMKRKDGSRTLLVPNIRSADSLDFAGFHTAYEELIRKVRTGKIGADDFAGTTVTLTNPGMIGTMLSVPRLMAGQGAIIGAGSIDYPVEYRGTDPSKLADLGIGKVVTLTSTYDHRIIQGAESGEFLDIVERFLTGDDRFYDDVFEALAIPYEPVRWARDTAPAAALDAAQIKAGRVLQLINMYRVRGHLIADINPLADEVRHHDELDPGYHELGVWDLDRSFFTNGLGGSDQATLRQALDVLRAAYCGPVGIEYMHIQEPDEKRWIQTHVEGVDRSLDHDHKLRLLDRLNAAEAFERFLHTKYVGHKRFSLEGGESLIPMLNEVLDQAAATGIHEVVIGMAHRGRLNVVTNVVGKSYVDVFRDFEGDIDEATTQGSGDVQYHLGASGTHTAPDGTTLAVGVAPNPSHLEAVNPVVLGMVRAKQDITEADNRHDLILPVLVHGDAAFAGQGVVQETLNLSQLRGYRAGGTVHVVVNNGIGFTAGPESTRSSVYATDVAKMIQAPIFHVNGDDPEACVWVMQLAFAFRQAFHKDVVVDLQCYRRWGHNEADEPAFTQPLMYARIDEHRSVRKLYTETLVNRGDITIDEAERALEGFRATLDDALEQTRASKPADIVAKPPEPPKGVRPHLETGIDRATFDQVAATLASWPDGFEPHPKLARLLQRNADQLQGDQIDWASGEALAWGSLLLEGHNVRITGQDSRRGTFSQRHSVLIDHRTGGEHERLEPLAAAGGSRILLFDSLLSEYAALGFEYGYALGNQAALVQWEAQFGDFVNGAQIVIDQYLVAAEDKWGLANGVVLLLPHGFEGQGPEHSSARIERFLTLCAEDNIQVTYPTLPAQYFHLLRRQVQSEPKRPLVVFTPKSLLRHPRARSAAADFTSGSFEEILPDPSAPDPSAVKRVLFCSGKVAVDLLEKRDEVGAADVAIARVEQLYPFPHAAFDEQLRCYPGAESVCWVQEEPENMGPWNFVFTHVQHQCPDIELVARPESGSPATGSKAVHGQEQAEVVEEALGSA